MGGALLPTIINVLNISAQKPQAGDDDSSLTLSPDSVKVENK
jgi:hypothetical protein